MSSKLGTVEPLDPEEGPQQKAEKCEMIRVELLAQHITAQCTSGFTKFATTLSLTLRIISSCDSNSVEGYSEFRTAIKAQMPNLLLNEGGLRWQAHCKFHSLRPSECQIDLSVVTPCLFPAAGAWPATPVSIGRFAACNIVSIRRISIRKSESWHIFLMCKLLALPAFPAQLPGEPGK